MSEINVVKEISSKHSKLKEDVKFTHTWTGRDYQMNLSTTNQKGDIRNQVQWFPYNLLFSMVIHL